MKRLICFGVMIVICALAPSAYGALPSTPASASTTPVPFPATIPADCSQPDSTDALESWLNALPADSSVVLPSNGCFHIQGSLWIHNTSGLTVDANGASFVQVAGPVAVVKPIVFLTQDSQFTLENLTIQGGYNGSNGGVDYEGDYGLLLEADHDVTLNQVTVNNIQGDFINLQAPDSGVTGDDQSLNTNIQVTNSEFHWCGYHGLTIESADGATFAHDSFSDIGVDAMDFEYDTYSTGFIGSQPEYAAEDNIQIVDDTWTSFGFYWFASLQGQLPGVQEQNVTLSGNTIINSTPASLFAVLGPDQAKTAPQYQFTGLVITDNRWTNGTATNDTAGSITTPYASSGANITHANDVTISNNMFPLNDGTPTYFPNTPFLAAMQADSVSGLRVENNNFTGALGVLHPYSADNANVTECGNRYQVDGSSVDHPCAQVSPRTPGPSPVPPGASPGTGTPEAPYAVVLPLLAVAAIGVWFLIHRRRARS
jgi:hypothetical protein